MGQGTVTRSIINKQYKAVTYRQITKLYPLEQAIELTNPFQEALGYLRLGDN